MKISNPKKTKDQRNVEKEKVINEPKVPSVGEFMLFKMIFIVCISIVIIIIFQFVGSLEKSTNKEAPILWSSRIQDSELQEMVDSGNCLTISQPYAYMIMEGVKL